jgi:hypothetical protein
MNYKKHHDKIIERAIGREYVKGVHEKHHIVPTSLGGGNTRTNLVNLTYREHFLIHWLLTKFTYGQDKQKMLHALYKMSHISCDHEYRVYSGWRYELSCKAQRLAVLGNSYAKGYKQSQETKNKISASLLKNSVLLSKNGKKTYAKKTDNEKKEWHSAGAKKSNVVRPLETRIRTAKKASDAAKLVVTKEEIIIRGRKGALKANSISPEERSDRQRRGWVTRRNNLKKLSEIVRG